MIIAVSPPSDYWEANASLRYNLQSSALEWRMDEWRNFATRQMTKSAGRISAGGGFNV